jgi:NOL1/NOP2/sun family putative RNA methylase
MNDQPHIFPLDFTRRLQQLVPQDKYKQINAALNFKRKTTLRVNTIKCTKETVFGYFTKNGISYSPVPWYTDACVIDSTPLRELTDLDFYKQGFIYVQSLSSMLPPLILDPKTGDRVLDIAAAPGSKTTQMAARMQNKGLIVANDTSKIRSYRLLSNLEVQGVTIAQVTNGDGRSVWQQYPEYFDKTLVDAPCSMEGRFNLSDPKSYEDWSLKKVRDLSILQRTLLRSAISATKTGGTIVYSTCTLSPEENEGVIDWILNKEKGNIRIEDIHIPNLLFDQGISAFAGKQYHPDVARALRIFPSETMEGFFVTKIKKLKSTIPTSMRISFERSEK